MQRPLGAVAGQEALTAAEHEGDDHQPEAVDEIVLHEALCQPAAADDVEVGAVLRLQLSNRVLDAALENVSVLPVERVGKRGRRDVLRQLVQRAGERLLVVACVRPVTGEELVRPAAEEEAAGRSVAVDDPPDPVSSK